MTFWTDRTFYVLKCDTTGLDPVANELLTVNIVKFTNGEYEDERSWVLNPKNGISADSVPFHGITPDWADKNGVPVEDVIEEITELIAAITKSSVPLVVFNSQFDLGFIEAAARKVGVTPLSEQVADWSNLVDPMLIAQGNDRYRTANPRRMQFTHRNVAGLYRVEYSDTVGALVHAETTALIMREQWAALDYLHKMTRAEVYELQSDWRERISSGLRDWMRRTNKDWQSVDMGWPISDKSKTATTETNLW